MKQQKEFYAIANDNNNRFLVDYKNNDRALLLKQPMTFALLRFLKKEIRKLTNLLKI